MTKIKLKKCAYVLQANKNNLPIYIKYNYIQHENKHLVTFTASTF